MAIFHLSAQIIGRGAGRSATAAAAYRLGTIIDDERTGLRFDYSHKHGVDGWQIIGPDNMPDCFHDPARLWNTVESIEKRKDAQLCREINIALPCELTAEQNRALVIDWCQDFANAGMIACVAFHHLREENPHAHVMLTLREVSSGGFGHKVRAWNDRVMLEQWREAWAKVVNQHLAHHAIAARVDHRTLEVQGIDRTPTQHQGPIACAMAQRGAMPDRVRVLAPVPPLMDHARAVQDLARERNEPQPAPIPRHVRQAMEAVATACEAHRLAVAEEARQQQAAHQSAINRADSLQHAEADRKASHAAEQWAGALKRKANVHRENIEHWKRAHRFRLWLWRHGVVSAIPDRVRKADDARAKTKRQAAEAEQMRHEADALALVSWSKYTQADNADKHRQRVVREAAAKVMKAAERVREAEAQLIDIPTPDSEQRQAKRLRHQQHTDAIPEALTPPQRQRGWGM